MNADDKMPPNYNIRHMQSDLRVLQRLTDAFKSRFCLHYYTIVNGTKNKPPGPVVCNQFITFILKLLPITRTAPIQYLNSKVIKIDE